MSLILEENNNVFKTKFTGSGSFIVILLGLASLALAERVLYDIARLLIIPPLNYFDNINIIIIHSLIVIIFLVIALTVNLSLSENKKQYAIALVPYYVVAIILSCQILLQISVYFYNHHTTTQFYVVMLALIAVCTYGIYYIQKRHVMVEQ
jgi:hypothetical protein